MQTLNACKNCIKFSAPNIQRLKFYEGKTYKKREMSNIFKVLYLAQNWLDVFEICIKYTRMHF